MWTKMAINWDSLNNVTALAFNTSQLSNSAELTNTLVDNADVVSEGYFGLGVMMIMFIVLLVFIFKDDGDIKMDIARSIMLSSGFTTILGVVALVLDIFSSFTHVMWFFVIFVFSLISVLFLKKKGF